MFKKEGNRILEIRVIPERQEVVRVFTPDEFTAYENALKASVLEGALKKGEVIIAREQKILDDITAAKAEPVAEPK